MFLYHFLELAIYTTFQHCGAFSQLTLIIPPRMTPSSLPTNYIAMMESQIVDVENDTV